MRLKENYIVIGSFFSGSFQLLLRKGIGGIFFLSSVLKVFAISYLTDLLFSLMPLNWVSWMTEGLLINTVMGVIFIELILGVLLWRGDHLSRVLIGSALFLTTMFAFNIFQIWSGIDDCGCLGGWVTIPPEATIAKTLTMLGIIMYLKIQHQEFDKRKLLSINQ